MKLVMSTAETWLGRPLRKIPDADLARFLICQKAARQLLKGEA